MQHIVEFAFSSFQKWGHIDPNRSGIGLRQFLKMGQYYNNYYEKFTEAIKLKCGYDLDHINLLKRSS